MKYFCKTNNCYICLNKINYYYKFDCECFQYIHDECFENINKCIICKKENFINIDINLINYYIIIDNFTKNYYIIKIIQTIFYFNLIINFFLNIYIK